MSYTKKTLNEIKNNLIMNLITNVDAINDANVGSVIDVLISAISQEFEEQYEDMDKIYKGTIITTATGNDLDNLGAIVGVTRNQGSKAQGTVTFIRANPSNSDFTISYGTIVSTEPNIGEEVYQFIVDADTTFYAEIVDEERTFRNGVYEYDFDQRLIDSITNLDAGGSFTEGTDYELQEEYNGLIIDTDSIVLLDDCELADWTAVGPDTDTIELNNNIYFQGDNSLELKKSGTTVDYVAYEKTLSSTVDLEDLDEVLLSIYVESSLKQHITELKLWFGSGSGTTHSYEFTYNADDLVSDDWKRFRLKTRNSVVNGNPQIDNINHLKIQVTFDDITQTVTDDQLLMDFWFAADVKEYEGTILKWITHTNLPTDGTTVKTTYKPLSVEVSCTAYDVGDEYNVAKGKIIYKVTNLTNIDTVYNYLTFTGGIDVESDSVYRDRIIHASDLANKATVKAIKANVEAIDFVKSANVDDMPLKNTVDETHVYDDSTKNMLYVIKCLLTILLYKLKGHLVEHQTMYSHQ